jgi:membrane protein DedA with SNARE-associated domain
VTAWIEGLIESWGAAGVAVLMFLENVFPPIPSELVLPLAGYKASQGHLSLPLALAAGTIGSLAGVTLWYLAARAVGTAGMKHFAGKHGRLLTLTPGDIDKVNDWFGRHGGKAVLIGRLVPGIRTLISIPAGVCGMSLTRFLLLSAIGTAAWSTLLILAGHTLGKEFDRVENWVSPVGNVVLAGAILYYLYRVITFRRHVG